LQRAAGGGMDAGGAIGVQRVRDQETTSVEDIAPAAAATCPPETPRGCADWCYILSADTLNANALNDRQEAPMATYTGDVIASTDDDYPFLAIITDQTGHVVGEFQVRTWADGEAKIEAMLHELKVRELVAKATKH
jgi:hypothetical protein